MYQENSSLIAEFTDNGIGIPVEFREKIFDKFFRIQQRDSHTGGTGIGLTVVKSIMDAHDAVILVESDEGREPLLNSFLKFKFYFMNNTKCRILVIEDDASILKGLKENLELENYTVSHESDGAKGLKAAKNDKPDLNTSRRYATFNERF